MSTVATGPGEHITVVVEREGDSKFEIKTTDLERVSSQLRKQRHFSLFSLCITIATVIVTSLVGQVAQYISWHNNRDDGPGQRSDNPSRRSLSKGGRDCNEKTLRHTDLPRRPERPRRLANRRRPFAGFQTRAEQDDFCFDESVSSLVKATDAAVNDKAMVTAVSTREATQTGNDSVLSFYNEFRCYALSRIQLFKDYRVGAIFAPFWEVWPTFI